MTTKKSVAAIAIAMATTMQLCAAEAASSTHTNHSTDCAQERQAIEPSNHLPSPRLSQPRIAPISLSELNDEMAEILDRVRQNGQIYNLFTTLAQHPELLEKWIPFASQVLLASTLPAREREIVVLRMGWLSQAEYEFGHHVAIGKQVGLTDEDIQRIIVGPEADGLTPFEATLLRSVDELNNDSFITDSTWQLLAQRYNTQQLIDLLFLAGNYKLVAMVVNSTGIQLEPGFEGFPQTP